ncbi:MAG: hypothetical protein AT717_07715 [Vulcanisaeta sp. CIS_19]|jgi:hypothetical protein|nr:MAG: hypothetical protein AT717_07715 [Vulcanisaeta sp. CIS_19]
MRLKAQYSVGMRALQRRSEDVLKALEITIRDIYRMMSKFIHPDSDKVKFSPRMVDAVYVFRQTVGIINYLVEISRA